ncbi:hypothetical protein EMCRGX_G020014 [Ephydatia muelleri]
MTILVFVLLATELSLSAAWPLPLDDDYCHNYCSAQNINNSACVQGCQAANVYPYSTVTCTFMCEDTYNMTGDVGACATGCSATVNSPSYIPVSFDFIWMLVMMDSLANQAYDLFPSTTGDISVITVFTSEEELSQWQMVQNVATSDKDNAAPLGDAYSTNCFGKHDVLFTHIALGSLVVLLIVMVISCATAVMDSAPKPRLRETLPLHLQKITPIVSLNTSDKLIKNSVITLTQ